MNTSPENWSDCLHIFVELDNGKTFRVPVSLADLDCCRRISKKRDPEARLTWLDVYIWRIIGLLSNDWSHCDNPEREERLKTDIIKLAAGILEIQKTALDPKRDLGMEISLSLDNYSAIKLERPKNYEEMYRFAMEGPAVKELVKTAIHM